jgi:hypothetical protein
VDSLELAYVLSGSPATSAAVTGGFLNSVDAMLTSNPVTRVLTNHELLQTKVFCATPVSTAGLKQWSTFESPLNSANYMPDASDAISRAGLQVLIVRFGTTADQTWDVRVHCQLGAVFPANTMAAGLHQDTPTQDEAALMQRIKRARAHGPVGSNADMERGRSRTPRPPGLITDVGIA